MGDLQAEVLQLTSPYEIYVQQARSGKGVANFVHPAGLNGAPRCQVALQKSASVYILASMLLLSYSHRKPTNTNNHTLHPSLNPSSALMKTP